MVSYPFFSLFNIQVDQLFLINIEKASWPDGNLKHWDSGSFSVAALRMIGSQSAGMKKLKGYSAAPAAFFREQPFARFRLDETAKGVDDIFSPIGRYFVFAHVDSQIDTRLVEPYTEEDQRAEISLMQPFSEQFDIDVAVLSEAQEKEAASKRKIVYRCQSCGDKAWGKPSLDLWCGKCKVPFVKLSDGYDREVETEVI